jgi:HTH-type transcriptional regulator / antitoxin HigA
MSGRTPAEVFPPGDYIRSEIDTRGWTQTDLAAILGRPLKTVNEILSAKKAITPETARELGEAFDIDPQFWMNLESIYRLSLARKPDDGVARRAKLYAKGPINDMIKRRWIVPSKESDVLEREVVRFFGLKTIDDEPMISASARKSTDYGETTPAQRAWLFRVKALAATLDVPVYDDARLDRLFAELRDLTALEPQVRRVPRTLAEFGIRFVVVEHLPKTRIDGAALWLDDRSPVVAVSTRYDRIDAFWHTLAHELAHIRNKDGLFLLDDNLIAERISSPDDRPEIERKADELARDILVPRDAFESFIARTRPNYSRLRILQFAGRIGVHAGIVVGQLQRRGEIHYSQHRDLLARIRDLITREALTDGWDHLPPPRRPDRDDAQSSDTKI